MENLYTELKDRQQEEFDSFPKFFAFDEKQYEAGMKGLGLNSGDEDKVCQMAYMYCRVEDAPRLTKMFENHNRELQEAVENDKTGEGFIKDMFLEELKNHEYSYSEDVRDTLDALGYTEEDLEKNPALKHGLEEAVETIEEKMYEDEDEDMMICNWELGVNAAYLDHDMISEISTDINIGLEAGKCDCALEWKFEAEGKTDAETQRLIAIEATPDDKLRLFDEIRNEVFNNSYGVCAGDVSGTSRIADEEINWTMKLETPAKSYSNDEPEMLDDILFNHMADGEIKGIESREISWTLSIDDEDIMTDEQKNEAMLKISEDIDKWTQFGTVHVHEEKEKVQEDVNEKKNENSHKNSGRHM